MEEIYKSGIGGERDVKIIDWIRKVWKKMLRKEAKAAGMPVTISLDMENAIELWDQMFCNSPPWKNGSVKTLNIPAAIAREIAKTATSEMDVQITGSQRAKDMSTEMEEKVFCKIRDIIEFMVAKGGVVLKPYVNGDDIEIDIVQAKHFYPVKFDSNGNITAAFFDDIEFDGNIRYVRFEYHELDSGKYKITNKAYKKEVQKTKADGKDMDVGEECPLSEVDRWAEIEPEVTLEDVEHVFFCYGKMPGANHIDAGSPLGTSIYALAVDAIKEADFQWTRILREYEEKEVVIQASSAVFETDRNGDPIVPHGKERRYEVFDTDIDEAGSISDLMKDWSPEIRDSSFFNGLNKILQKIEFLCGLAYGTISDPLEFEKTATEIKSSKQRMFVTVQDIQKAAGEMITDLVLVIGELMDAYELSEDGECIMSIDWGDSILTDRDTEYQRRWAWVQSNRMKPEKFFAWYFHCTEEEALEMLPEAFDPYQEEE